jgi:hypothetical protein
VVRDRGAPPVREDADVLGGRNLGAPSDPDPVDPAARGAELGRVRGLGASAYRDADDPRVRGLGVSRDLGSDAARARGLGPSPERDAGNPRVRGLDPSPERDAGNPRVRGLDPSPERDADDACVRELDASPDDIRVRGPWVLARLLPSDRLEPSKRLRSRGSEPGLTAPLRRVCWLSERLAAPPAADCRRGRASGRPPLSSRLPEAGRLPVARLSARPE